MVYFSETVAIKTNRLYSDDLCHLHACFVSRVADCPTNTNVTYCLCTHVINNMNNRMDAIAKKQSNIYSYL